MVVSSKYLLHYRALKDYIEADTLGDLYHILRQVKVGVESCTFAVLKAVRRPKPSLLREARVAARAPVP